VFAAVADPVGAGFVHNLARPGGDATGFMAFEYSISAKWLELLKQIAPSCRSNLLQGGLKNFERSGGGCKNISMEPGLKSPQSPRFQEGKPRAVRRER
jgi:hypothetical protein